MYQLFSPYWNLALRPEQGKTFEIGLEQNMGNYNVDQQLNSGTSVDAFEKVVYLCILKDECGVKKYVIIDNIEKVRDFSKNLNCENTLRISVGLPEENNRLIDALKSLSI